MMGKVKEIELRYQKKTGIVKIETRHSQGQREVSPK